MEIIEGSILDANTDYIAHQVNCKGVMGSGVALALRQKWGPYLENYFVSCRAFSRRSYSLLGTYVRSDLPTGQSIINLFGQDTYGHGKHTIERSLQEALIRFCNDIPTDGKQYTCAIPYKIGCGRGGGNWVLVYDMLQQVEGHFSDKVKFILYRYSETK